jgi:phosphatidylglycerol:prolipoprotein diacylglycerol transferase
VQLAFIAYPQIDPVLLHLGPIKIHWYGLAYVVGMLAITGIAWWLNERWSVGLSQDDVVLGALYGVVGLLVGARLGYVLFYGGGAYFEQPAAIFSVWDGGMSFHGGAIGLALAGVLYARKVEPSFLRLADMVVVGAPVALFLGRLANFVNDELWGRETDVPWAMIAEGYPPRHPSQLYEALLEGVLIFVVMLILARKRRPDGFMTGVFLVLYGSVRFLVEFVREPDVQLGFLAGDWLTMGMLLSLPFVLAGAVLIVYSLRSGASRPGAA